MDVVRDVVSIVESNIGTSNDSEDESYVDSDSINNNNLWVIKIYY